MEQLLQTEIDPVKIVLYEPKYAASIADMWNRSRESWGDGPMRTEEQILRDHENDTKLNVFLAVDGDVVAGYCSFSHSSKQEEEALYVPLLNVRPDYHGRKLGKHLILNAVRRTAEMGYPRLDLNTWPGNLKAVPMYKKCGFFWEKDDKRTRLMNFIPYLLQAEFFKDCWRTFDWYNDQIRPIVVEPDGREQNGFEFYEYVWEKDGRRLTAEFERTGRGLRRVETEQLEIICEIDRHSWLFGDEVPVRYIIRNKSRVPLLCSITGTSNRNVQFTLNEEQMVEREAVIEGTAVIGSLESVPDKSSKHPSVVAEISINGRRMQFRTGLMTRHPGRVELRMPEGEKMAGTMMEAYVLVENCGHDIADFELTLPDNPILSFTERQVLLTVEAESRKCVRVPLTVNRSGHFKEAIQILKNGQTSFTYQLQSSIRNRTSFFSVDTDSGVTVYVGQYALKFNKNGNKLSISDFDNNCTAWIAPMLGDPLSDEWNRTECSLFEGSMEGHTGNITFVLDSEAFPGYSVKVSAKLYPEGLVEHYMELLRKEGFAGVRRPAVLLENFNCGWRDSVLSLDGRLIRTSEQSEYSDWDFSRLTESYLFNRNGKFTAASVWQSGMRPIQHEGHPALVHRIPVNLEEERNQKDGEGTSVIFRTPVSYAALGTFKDWKECRKFAWSLRGRSVTVQPEDQLQDLPILSDDTEWSINRKNPFVTGPFDIALIDYMKRTFHGTVELSSKLGTIGKQSACLDENDLLSEFKMKAIGLQANAALDILRLSYDHRKTVEVTERAVFFPNNEHKVRVTYREEGERDNRRIWEADNDVLKISASAEYGPCLYSLECRGREWLDSLYPAPPGPRSWSNPWAGGLLFEMRGIGLRSLLKEQREVSQAERMDIHGNRWEGLRIMTHFSKQTKYNGISYSQDYLMLPGLPVLASVTEWRNDTDVYHPNFKQQFSAYIRHQSGMEWMQESGKPRFRLGSRHDTSVESALTFGSEEQDDRLTIIGSLEPQKSWAYTEKDVTSFATIQNCSISPRERFVSRPLFLVVHDMELTGEMLRDMQDLRF